MNNKAAEMAEHLRKHWSGPMTPAEIDFLRDVQGFIEFAIRNGLSFRMTMSGIVPDFNEISREGFDYEHARSKGFRPKVSGYSKLSSDDFGATDEPEPPS